MFVNRKLENGGEKGGGGCNSVARVSVWLVR